MPMVMDDARRAEASSARRDRRLKTSSPYARPAKKVQKTSSWGGLGNLFRNLFGGSSKDEDDTTMDETQDQPEEAPQHFIPPKPTNNAAYSLSQRGHQMSSQLAMNGDATRHEGPRFSRPTDAPMPVAPPVTSPTNSTFSDAPDNEIEKVTAYLREKQGKPMSEIETEGIIAILSKSTPHKETTFRFSTSPASTPGRGDSPASSVGTNGDSTTPRKPLRHNPNGNYRWEGGGSAKARARNRYHSPSFGASRSTPEHITLRDPSPAEPPKRDYSKRRRVGEGAQSTSAAPSGSINDFNFKTPAKIPPRSPGPAPTPGRAAYGQNVSIETPGPSKNGSGPSNNLLSPSAARTPKKPSFPSVPSPLRQTWNGDDSSSEGGSPRHPSKAATMMEDLIKEVTPAPRKVEIINPYQSAVPGGKPMSRPKRAKQKKVAKDAAPADKEAEEKAKAGKGKEKAKAEPPQAAIELTLPAGSKRSRPPAHLASSQSSAPAESQEPIIEEPSDEDDGPAAKRQKGSAAPANGSDIDITEVEEDMPVPSSPKPAAAALPAKRPSAFGNGNGNVKSKVTSAPKEPSKLRFSIQPEAGAKDDEAVAGDAKADAPKAAPFSFGGSAKPTLAGFGFPSTRVDAAKAPVSAFGKSSSEAPASTAPAFSFGQPAAAEPLKAAPAFSFGKPQETPTKPQAEAPKPAVLEAPKPAVPDATMAGPSSSLTPQSVEEAKAAAHAVPADALPKYTFPKLSLTTSSGADATVCAEAKAVAPEALPRFDFGTTAVKASADAAAKAGPSSAPAAAAKPAPASGGFNWVAAGMKPPAPAGWTCGLCMVPNKNDAVKCASCEEPRPGGAAAAAAAEASAGPASTPKPAGGFNWAAAGLKPPEATGWTCSLCMVPNKGEATKCVSCEEPKP